MLRSSAGLVVAALTLGLSLSACVRDEKLPERVAKAWCDYLVECGEVESIDVCMEINGHLFEDPYLEDAVDAGRVDYRGGRAYRCVRAIKKLKCQRGEEVADVDEVCDAIYVGEVAPDQPCLRAEECAGGASVCAYVPSACQDACCVGVCRFIPDDLAIGEACDVGECAEGGYCGFSEAAGAVVCKELPEVGEPCPDWVCVDEASCVDGTCAGPIKRGDPCAYGDRCDGTDYCELRDGELAGTCQKRADEGEACDGDNSCLRLRDRCVAGTCQEGAAVGEGCAAQRDCIGYAYCDQGVCAAFRAVGESCLDHACYPGLACRDSTCVNLADSGEEAVCSLPE
ncbi:MAG: hypothetical protein R3A79_17250 [Nannocystaceae bacterium]